MCLGGIGLLTSLGIKGREDVSIFVDGSVLLRITARLEAYNINVVLFAFK
jgi:hypothetical protein